MSNAEKQKFAETVTKNRITAEVARSFFKEQHAKKLGLVKKPFALFSRKMIEAVYNGETYCVSVVKRSSEKAMVNAIRANGFNIVCVNNKGKTLSEIHVSI